MPDVPRMAKRMARFRPRGHHASRFRGPLVRTRADLATGYVQRWRRIFNKVCARGRPHGPSLFRGWDGLAKDQLRLTAHDAHAESGRVELVGGTTLCMRKRHRDAPAEGSRRRARRPAAPAVGCCGRDAAGTSASAVGQRPQPEERPIHEPSAPTPAQGAPRAGAHEPQTARRTRRAAAADAAGASGPRPPAATQAGRAGWATAREAERSAALPMRRTSRPRPSRRPQAAATAPAAGPPATATGLAPAGRRRGPLRSAGVHWRHQGSTGQQTWA